MSTAADWRDIDEHIDPDTLKVPENPEHRRVVDAIGIVASRELRPHTVVYRDMNWYPPDGGNAVAPDLMTLPVGALASGAKSYKQLPGMPFPGVVIEVPSDTDTFNGMRAKAARYRSLGVDLYVISADSGVGAALRFSASSADPVTWTGLPIESLGGLTVEVVDTEVMIRTSDGVLISADVDLVRGFESDRILELEAKLRALGVEP